MNKFKIGDVVMRALPPARGFHTSVKVGDVCIVIKTKPHAIYLDKCMRGHNPEAFVLISHNFENI